MSKNRRHIDTTIVSGRPGLAYGRMYSMHKYWSKKSPDVVSAYIERYTRPGEIVLDPFCGSGVVACEAVRLGRRAIAIDINPVATFMTRTTLTPVNLSRLRWAFDDVRNACEEVVLRLFPTRCRRCGKDGVAEFLVRDGNIPVQVAYNCSCSNRRLFKDADERDKSLDSLFERRGVSLWYPRDTPLPVIQKERFRYVHELFTKRNLIALSTILDAVEKQEDTKIRDVLKLAFSAALDKCSRLKPLSRARAGCRPSLSEGWVAVRFYAPKMWQEVNPWYAFVRSFERVYEGKKESNAKLKHAVVGSSYDELHAETANVALFTGPADTVLNEQLPKGSVHYVLTDPPYVGRVQYLALSTFWGAWLKSDFEYDRELVVNRHRGKTIEDYERDLGEVFKSIRRVTKANNYIHIFYHDIHGPYLHTALRLMCQSSIVPERVLHQPPPKSFGAAVRLGKGHYGSYIIRGRVGDEYARARRVASEHVLRERIAQAARAALRIRGGNAPVGTVLHSVYQKLRGEEILTFAQHPAEGFLEESIKEFAFIEKGQVHLAQHQHFIRNHDIYGEIRNALLDARSLYGDQKNQVYQSVQWRFQDQGITMDDVRTVENDITQSQVRKYRTRRLARLLCPFGRELGFKHTSANEVENQVTWKSDDGVTCQFLVGDRVIEVSAVQTLGGQKIASEVGTIPDHKSLERALWEWCQHNRDKGDELRKAVNPIAKTPIPVPSPKHLLLKVLENKQLCPEYYLITLKLARGVHLDPQPGQFFHLVCDPEGKRTATDRREERGYPLTLRRPFSAHRLHYAGFDRRLLAARSICPYEIRHIVQRRVTEIDILYKRIGEGTRSLSRIRSGELLDVIGPIGNGFNIDTERLGVIVAGGIGVAPLVALAEKLRYLGLRVYMYLGAVTAAHIAPLLRDSTVERSFIDGVEFCQLIEREFREIGAEQVRVCTDDGSVGQAGYVTDILRRDMESGFVPTDRTSIYACGPREMMKEISRLAHRYKVPCQVLLEERMACGIGACLSCTCRIRGKDGTIEKKRVCVDGPVFRAEEVVWEH